MGWASRNNKGQGTRPRQDDRAKARRRPKDDLRLSERLVDLIAPFREDSLAREHYEALIGAAAIAWNLTALPKNERPGALAEAFRNTKVKDIRNPAEMIVTLMRRKEELFPDDDRIIVHWEVSESDDQYHVTVASTAA